MASSSGSSARNVFSGYFGPGPASSSESLECATPPGFMRVHPLGRWRCFICRQRYARMRDLRGHIRSVHSQVNSMYNDRGAFPFFRRCLTCHRQHRSNYETNIITNLKCLPFLSILLMVSWVIALNNDDKSWNDIESLQLLIHDKDLMEMEQGRRETNILQSTLES